MGNNLSDFNMLKALFGRLSLYHSSKHTNIVSLPNLKKLWCFALVEFELRQYLRKRATYFP